MSLLLRITVVLLAAFCWTASSDKLSWWQNAVFYQIYPRSYQDTDGNGIGDLKGMLDHVDYLKELGVNGIWMNPIYDSPLKDFGYDISNYTSIDKTFGTFQDFTALVDKLHSLGLKILVDLVPNHSSNEHPWFKESVKRNSNYSDYYVWSSGESHIFSENSIPNNWASVMGGSAWEWDDTRKQYYYHAFLKEQPDLNYRNPKVVEEIKNVLKFWLDLGVDGFRVDAVPFLVEDSNLKDEPYQGGCTPAKSPGCLNHIYTQNQDGTFEVLAQFYKELQDYNNSKYPGEKIMVVEAYTDLKTLQKYFVYKGKKTSTMPFNFEMINVNMNTNGTEIKQMIDSWSSNLISGGWSNWVTGNHDQNRVGHKVGIPMTDGMNMIVLLLPGTSFSYYGEELGMDDTYVYCFQMQDTQAIRQAGTDCDKMEALSRDPERTPMQWNTSTNGGFSNAKPWLPLNPDYYETNVESQKSNPKSHLNVYKNLISLKNEMKGCKYLHTKTAASGWILLFERYGCDNSTDKYIVIVNFNNEEETINISKDFHPENMFIRAVSKYSDKKIGAKVALSSLTLRAKEGLVLSTVSSASFLTSSVALLAATILMSLLKLKH